MWQIVKGSLTWHHDKNLPLVFAFLYCELLGI